MLITLLVKMNHLMIAVAVEMVIYAREGPRERPCHRCESEQCILLPRGEDSRACACGVIKIITISEQKALIHD